jgi:hypothetical protein
MRVASDALPHEPRAYSGMRAGKQVLKCAVGLSPFGGLLRCIAAWADVMLE